MASGKCASVRSSPFGNGFSDNTLVVAFHSDLSPRSNRIGAPYKLVKLGVVWEEN